MEENSEIKIEEINSNTKARKKSKDKTIKEELSQVDSKRDIVENVSIFDIEGKFIHIKVGDKESPADDEEVEDIQNKVIALLEKHDINCAVLVTHHAVEVSIVR